MAYTFEEGWFGQPKYSTPSKNHSTLCRFLLLNSSLYLEIERGPWERGCVLPRFLTLGSLKQITTAGATTAAVTEKVCGEYSLQSRRDFFERALTS